MTLHKINIHEAPVESADQVDAFVEVERFAYEVVNPIFKRGKAYRRGSTVELDERTAAAFLEAGDIKEKK